MKSGACRTTLVWDRSVLVLGQPYAKVRAMSVFSTSTPMVFSLSVGLAAPAPYSGLPPTGHRVGQPPTPSHPPLSGPAHAGHHELEATL
jgi:hypothetical protein